MAVARRVLIGITTLAVCCGWAASIASAAFPGRNGLLVAEPTTGRVSCASTSLCAAVDGDGSVLASRTPLRGPSWTTTSVDAGNQLSSIACPTASLCVAVDAAGNAATSTDPSGGPGAWTISYIDADVTSTGAQAALRDVSCPSVRLCVAVDSAGNALTFVDPTGGAAA